MNTIITKNNTADPDVREIARVSEKLGLLPKLTELLFSRGIETEEEIVKFLHPDADNLFDPYLLKNMSEVTERIRRGMDDGETFVIYGDYDADGVCSSAILSLFFASRGMDVVVHIPNRENDGYGLNVASIESIIEEHCPDLILTCDCGISGIEEVDYCQELGVDIIVTDHHEPGDVLPSCPIINPKQPGDEYPDKYLCGAGVALKLVQALCGDASYLEFLDIAAVATIADLVPLLRENRLIVQLGLEKLASGNCNLGLKKLLGSQGISDRVQSADIAYKIAPRINAAGRMGDAFRAFEMLTTRDTERIDAIVSEIERANDLRKELCDQIYAEAETDLTFEDIVTNRAIILVHPTWSKGVTGIAAARFAGEYHRPTFIIVDKTDEGIYKGTARGIKGINIYDALSYCSDLLVEFGGHTGAAGFSVKEENIPAFKARMNEYMAQQPERCFLPSAEYDLELDAEDCNIKLLNALSLIEPTGNSNSKPLFLIKTDKARVFPCKNPIHSSVQIGNLQTYAFNFQNRNQYLMGSGEKEIIVELTSGLNGGVSGYIKAVGISELYINDKLASANYLASLLLKDNRRAPVYRTYEKDRISDLLPESIYGTLFICADRASYERIVALGGTFVMHDYMYRSEKNNYSGIIVSPIFDDNFSVANYKKIVFADDPPSAALICELNARTSAEIYVPAETSDRLFSGISTDRNIFAGYYSAIKSHPEAANASVMVYFKRLSAAVPGLDARQFVICLAVFTELGFFVFADGKLAVAGGVQRPLTESVLYRKLLDR